MDTRKALERLFRSAVAACHPSATLPRHLPRRPAGRAIVLAAGKAAGDMAAALEAAWDGPLDGLVVTRHGFGPGAVRRLPVIEAGHPVPDEASEAAARRVLALAGSARPGDTVLVLLSGGASSLLAAPGPGLALEDKRVLTRALLRSGATIAEMNTVRRHLSSIKGGRLALAAGPAELLTLAISDVVGDAPAAIGSGPTVADPTTLADAKAILARYGVPDPGAGWSETVKPGHPALARGRYTVIASAAELLAAASVAARALGYTPLLLGEALEGEAREMGAAHARAARDRRGQRVALISGGELTVTVEGKGRGGPNQEYALALALGLNEAAGIHALAADTDGVDGSHDVAGAFVTPDTLARMAARGIDPGARLADNDSGSAFLAIGDLLETGPTGTNVNDLRVILVD